MAYHRNRRAHGVGVDLGGEHAWASLAAGAEDVQDDAPQDVQAG